MRSGVVPWLGGAALIGCAVFLSGGLRDDVLIALMLGYPLLDSAWRPPPFPRHLPHQLLFLGAVLVALYLLLQHPTHWLPFVSTLLFAALPEEWFFRAYLMARTGVHWRANVTTSLLFSALHGITHDAPTAALVFIPSLIFGYLYQQTRNFPLVVITHAISNLIFLLGFGVWLYRVLGIE